MPLAVSVVDGSTHRHLRLRPEAPRQRIVCLDAQLRDLFDAARVTRRDPTATIADGVTAFKAKRTEIVSRHCSGS